jgi:enoyl-CoA hydratase
VTLDRPTVRNAINAAMREDLPRAIRAADANPDVRAIVIRGAGPKAFCAGADIREFTPPSSLTASRQAKQSNRWLDALALVGKPTIAAIHGYCLGGGLEIALACDIRIAADDAIIALPEVTLGIIPGAGGTQRLPRAIGLGPALRLMLTGERIDAQEAYRIGLVSKVVKAADLDLTWGKLGEQLSEAAPRALAYTKEAARRGAEMSLEDGLRLEADLSTLIQGTRDRIEGASAFRERRKPVYLGD